MSHQKIIVDDPEDARIGSAVVRATAIGAGTEMQQLATFTTSTQAHLAELRKGLTEALTKRDAAFGDYRTETENG